ncbi:MAG: RNase adapter RapZ [Alphaproteobacteria bacterium]
MSARGRLCLVTGLSGAGKSTALKALEDLGYETVDNLPVKLVAALMQSDDGSRGPLAIGIDARTYDFRVEAVEDELQTLAARSDLAVSLVFLDCDDNVLGQRFTETRRRHPLAADRPISDGIRHERQLMAPLRARADLVLDTTDMTIADLGRLLDGHYAIDEGPPMRLFVTSFGFRNGLPREADLVFDVRFLSNPHYVEPLRPLTGLDSKVDDYVTADPFFAPFFDRLCAMLVPLLPRYVAEGKSYLTIAIGCTGGRHRSVAVGERLARRLGEESGVVVAIRHRDIDH